MVCAKLWLTTATGKLIYTIVAGSGSAAKIVCFGLPTLLRSRPSFDRYNIDPAIPGRT